MMTDNRQQKTTAYHISSHKVFVSVEPHTCEKFQRGIREVFRSFPGGFLKKKYRIYKNILHFKEISKFW